MNFLQNRRFRPLDIGLAMLFAGWIPSILMGTVAYTILSRTLESKIVVDRNTLVQTLAQLIGSDVVRSGEVMQHYQTLPLTHEMVQSAPGEPAVQEWLAQIYYSHPRLDGMFITDPEGKLLAALPLHSANVGKDYSTAHWIQGTELTHDFYVSPAYERLPDGRPSVAIAVPVRSKSGETIGYMGTTILIERLGRRISDFNIGEQSVAQVIDQHGFPLFKHDFAPNRTAEAAPDPELLHELRVQKAGHFRRQDKLYTFAPIAATQWTAVLSQPLDIAYKPLRELLSKTVVLAAWLLALTAVAAWLVSSLYKRQLEADERLARETLFTERILANMPIGIALVDPGTEEFLQVNEAFVEMAGLFGGIESDGDLSRLRFSDINFGLKEMFRKVVAYGIPFKSDEQKVETPKGVPHFLTIDLIRVQDAQQRIQGILFLIEDQTADVKLRKELIDANAAKDHFMAMLSHELRNPLTPVLAMVSELEELAGDSQEVSHALDVIRRNVELEARLIDDLLDVTRVAHGKLQLNLETVNAHQIMRRALEICQPDIDAKRLELVVDMAAAEHYLKADPARLQQIFWNIIKNAVKFTPAGRITIRSYNEKPECLTVEIIDTGIGIEAERLEKIFFAFDQGEENITRRFGGLGLGLAISKAMVEAHGGTLRATSSGKHRGATFQTSFDTVPAPIRTGAQPSAPAAVPASRHPDGAARVLIVDDHEDTCRGMKLLLERRGYRVSTAQSIAEAIKVAQDNHFDVLISDLGLPDGSGLELMKRLAAADGILGIALSGFGNQGDVEKSSEAGFAAHLTKPVDVERLDTVLKELLSSSSARSG